MKWLLCHPVKNPVDNLANWITMDAVRNAMALLLLPACEEGDITGGVVQSDGNWPRKL